MNILYLNILFVFSVVKTTLSSTYTGQTTTVRIGTRITDNSLADWAIGLIIAGAIILFFVFIAVIVVVSMLYNSYISHCSVNGTSDITLIAVIIVFRVYFI